MFEGMSKEEELGLYVDPGALCRRSEPGETNLYGTKLGPTGPSSRVPERCATHGAIIGEADLSKGKEHAGLPTLEVRIEILRHL
jgi:hypothetical protein